MLLKVILKPRKVTTRTYLKWMKAVRWTRSAALAGLDSYSATGFDAIETVERIIDQLDTMTVTKNELKANMQILKRFLKFDFKSSIEDCSSGCGFHCDSFALSQNPSSGCNLDQKPRLKKKDDDKHSSGCKMEFVQECACIDHASICLGCKNQVDIFARIREINIITGGFYTSLTLQSKISMSTKNTLFGLSTKTKQRQLQWRDSVNMRL